MSNAAARRYAKALFELANEGKSLKTVESQVDELAGAIEGSDELSSFIASPLASREVAENVISSIAKKAKFHDLLTNTLKVMVQKGRMSLIPEMIVAFRELAAQARDELVAEVISAKALTKAQEKKLADTLKAKMGKAVAIENIIDESLIGGLVVKMGSIMIDSSVKGKLSKLHNVMKEVG